MYRLFAHLPNLIELERFFEIFEFWLWTKFLDFLRNSAQKIWDSFDFLQIPPTLRSNISMTTGNMTKSNTIFNMYSLRAVDCAYSRCSVLKTDIRSTSMKNEKIDNLTLGSLPLGHRVSPWRSLAQTNSN